MAVIVGFYTSQERSVPPGTALIALPETQIGSWCVNQEMFIFSPSMLAIYLGNAVFKLVYYFVFGFFNFVNCWKRGNEM